MNTVCEKKKKQPCLTQMVPQNKRALLKVMKKVLLYLHSYLITLVCSHMNIKNNTKTTLYLRSYNIANF